MEKKCGKSWKKQRKLKTLPDEDASELSEATGEEIHVCVFSDASEATGEEMHITSNISMNSNFYL